MRMFETVFPGASLEELQEKHGIGLYILFLWS
jgi:hypothetical protein